jgi:hypothetical protein
VTVQVGLNGVDNGAIRFTNVRVPRENLLNRFATVDKSGRYSSPLTSEVGGGGIPMSDSIWIGVSGRFNLAALSSTSHSFCPFFFLKAG